MFRESESGVIQMFLIENETILIIVQKNAEQDLSARIKARRMPDLTEIYRYDYNYRTFFNVVTTKSQSLLVLVGLSQSNRVCLIPVSSRTGEVLYKIRLHHGAELIGLNAMPHQSNQVVLIEQEKSTIWDIKVKRLFIQIKY